MPPRKAALSGKSVLSKPQGKKARPKPTPKQPLPVPERVKRLFTSLCAQIDGGHFANAIKTCDKSECPLPACITGIKGFHYLLVLRLEPGDKDALQTKLFLLLQTEQYTAALTLLEGSSDFLYERTYALYRTNQENEARNALNDLKRAKGEDDRGTLHLEAQLVRTRIACPRSTIALTHPSQNYREGSYESAFELYNQLLDTSEPVSGILL